MKSLWEAFVNYCETSNLEMQNIINTMGPQSWLVVGAVIAGFSILLLRTNFD